MDFTFRVKKVVFPHEIFARMRKRFFPLQKTAEERERGKRRKRGKREKSTTTHIILVNSYSFLAKWEKIPTLRIWYLSKMGAKEKEAKRRDNFTENGYVPLDYFMEQFMTSVQHDSYFYALWLPRCTSMFAPKVCLYISTITIPHWWRHHFLKL